MAFRIEKIKGITGTAALPILVRAWADILEAGLVTTRSWLLNYDDEAILIFDVGELINGPIGVISFAHQEWSKEIILKIGYVRPEYRHRHCYEMLWSELVKHAQSIDCPMISGGAMLRNTPIREFCKKVGRREEVVWIAFDVPPVATS